MKLKNNKNIIITGGSGFICKNTVPYCLNKKYKN